MSDTHHAQIRDLVKSFRERSEEITHFEAYAQGYYALFRTGARLDIMRVQVFQPPIRDFDDYFGYMFVQARFGYYILRQHIFENKARPWELYLEIEPRDPVHFFSLAAPRAHELLELAGESDDAHTLRNKSERVADEDQEVPD